jgi:hypothetical protein
MSVYQDIANLSKPFLGPAAEQFIAKQCQTYLNIAPAALTRAHLKDLATWVDIGGARFMDSAKCKELCAKIARY